MACRYCKGEIPSRPRGRGRRRTAFCNDVHKNLFNREVRLQAARLVARRKERKHNPPKLRINHRLQETALKRTGLGLYGLGLF